VHRLQAVREQVRCYRAAAQARQRRMLNTAIVAGAVATALTLVFLPALYVAWFRIKRPDPDAGPKMDLERLLDIPLEDSREGLAKADDRELETTTHL